jgi:hypothetical protein
MSQIKSMIDKSKMKKHRKEYFNSNGQRSSVLLRIKVSSYA